MFCLTVQLCTKLYVTSSACVFLYNVLYICFLIYFSGCSATPRRHTSEHWCCSGPVSSPHWALTSYSCGSSSWLRTAQQRSNSGRKAASVALSRCKLLCVEICTRCLVASGFLIFWCQWFGFNRLVTALMSQCLRKSRGISRCALYTQIHMKIWFENRNSFLLHNHVCCWKCFVSDNHEMQISLL